MKQIFAPFKTRLAKVLMATVACALFLMSTASPAMAFGGSRSNPSEGTARMNRLQETSKRAVKSEPRSRRQVQEKARRGPNEVQGSADLHGMNVPDNSKKATTVRKQAEEALKKVTPGNS